MSRIIIFLALETVRMAVEPLAASSPSIRSCTFVRPFCPFSSSLPFFSSIQTNRRWSPATAAFEVNRGEKAKPSRLIIIIDGRRVRVRDYDKSTTGYSEFITRLARMRFRSRSSYSHKFEKESGFWKGAHRILYERCTRGSLGVVVAFDQSSSPHGNKNIGEKRRHGRSVSSWFHSYTIGVPPFFEIQ